MDCESISGQVCCVCVCVCVRITKPELPSLRGPASSFHEYGLKGPFSYYLHILMSLQTRMLFPPPIIVENYVIPFPPLNKKCKKIIAKLIFHNSDFFSHSLFFIKGQLTKKCKSCHHLHKLFQTCMIFCVIWTEVTKIFFKTFSFIFHRRK